MMSGLMLVFLFIAIGFMIEVQSKKDQMENIAKTYRDNKANINEVLHDEFEEDLKYWKASITKDNSIVFNSPEVLFGVNKTKIEDHFKNILDQFCPRLVDILIKEPYKSEIKEITIEGHTSNKWGKLSSPKEIYLNNMRLSQNRAYSVLSYCYNLDDERIKQNQKFIQKFFRANGMAFSKPKEGEFSRRVEFSIELHSEGKILEILK